MQYHINLNGSVIGPMSAHEVFNYPVNQTTPVSGDGSQWQPLYMYPELMGFIHRQMMQENQMQQSELSNKKLLCGLMAIFFGYLGVQYFILGKTAGGFISILLSVVTCGVWSVVTLIQGILMLCMSDAEFKSKYIDSTSTMPLF